MNHRTLFGLVSVGLVLCHTAGLRAADANEELREAARNGNNKTVEELLAKGADVNAPTHYGATPLWFAAYKEHVDTVELLLQHHADPNVIDHVWGFTPINFAAGIKKPADADKMIEALLKAGADPDAALMESLGAHSVSAVRTVLKFAKLQPETLGAALAVTPAKQTEILQLLREAGARPLTGASGADLKRLQAYTGTYETHNGMKLTITLDNGLLKTQSGYGDTYLLKPEAADRFPAYGFRYVSFIFARDAQGKVVRATRKRGTIELPFERTSEDKAAVAQVQKSDEVEPTGTVSAPRPWPSFRGENAVGVADGQFPPTAWDVGKGTNIRWKTPIPGLAHSSPVVWGDRLFVTTAVSKNAKTEFKPGLYGAGTSSSDNSVHSWRVYCVSAGDGKILWEKTAHEGVPKFKRHVKSSQNNQTPAVDGKHVIAYFASEGLYAYDFDGKLLWKQDVGPIDVGAFNDPDLQWGAASSPIIYKNLVIVQCDRQKNSFVAAYDLETGKPVWSTPRDEPPSWATPTVIHGPHRDELITNSPRYAHAYDPLTGKELWRIGPQSEITTPTPFLAEGLIFITNGYHPIQPIYAVLPGGSGDISPKESGSGPYVAWSKKRGGPYMPTPIVYGPYLYVCLNGGMMSCYDARTGEQIYKQRLGGSDGYSASPVAADGRIYFPGEDGDIKVVKAGRKFELIANNKMNDPCMATPAISNGMIFVRTQHFLYGIGGTQTAQHGPPPGGAR